MQSYRVTWVETEEVARRLCKALNAYFTPAQEGFSYEDSLHNYKVVARIDDITQDQIEHVRNWADGYMQAIRDRFEE